MPKRAPELEDVVRAWLDAKQAADAQDISRRLSAYKGALAIGTDAGEWWEGAER